MIISLLKKLEVEFDDNLDKEGDIFIMVENKNDDEYWSDWMTTTQAKQLRDHLNKLLGES